MSKNKKKKKRKKNKKDRENEEREKQKELENGKEGEELIDPQSEVEIEYVQEKIGLHELAPQYRQFYSIFEQFKISDEKSNIPPPTLANITSLSHSKFDDMNEDNEESEEVGNTLICLS